MAKAIDLLNLLKIDSDVEILADLDDKCLFRVPLDRIESHPNFKAIRGRDPKDRNHLRKSIKAGRPLYAPMVYLESDDFGLHIFAADGHQRLGCLKDDPDVEFVEVTWPKSWVNKKTAISEAAEANWARYEFHEFQIISLLRDNNDLTQAQIAKIVGKDESVISKYATVAEYDWMIDIIVAQCISYSVAASLLKECGEPPSTLSRVSMQSPSFLCVR